MTKKESRRARQWMEARGLTQARLAELTGYAEITLYWFFRNEVPPDRRRTGGKIQPYVWQRFKMCCAAVEAQLKNGEGFDW